MARHQSNVNFQKLIKDLAEMYPYEVPEVVFVELIANALDSKARTISIEWDEKKRILTITDDGEGMSRHQFAEYHDFAAALKTRGEGIGFAGVGAKISFNIADRVLTETRSQRFSGGSDWYLLSNKRLVWDEISSTLAKHGTRVAVYMRDRHLVPTESNEYFERLIRRHYLPLLDKRFLQVYSAAKIYPNELRFVVNGRALVPTNIGQMTELKQEKSFVPKLKQKRIGFGIFGLSEREYPMGEHLAGILLSTYGKVIKSDFFNQYPGDFGPKIFGVIEIPDLIHHLTTAKTDFIRRRDKGRNLEMILQTVREEFKSWLSGLGIKSPEVIDDKEARQLEKELKKIVDAVPELADFLGTKSKTRVLIEAPKGHMKAAIVETGGPSTSTGGGSGGGGVSPTAPGGGEEPTPVETPSGPVPAKPISRVAPKGPKITFYDSPEKVEVAWVEGGRIVINSGHPAYRRTTPASKERRLHDLFSVGAAIQRWLTQSDSEPNVNFMDRMMKAWGESG